VFPGEAKKRSHLVQGKPELACAHRLAATAAAERGSAPLVRSRASSVPGFHSVRTVARLKTDTLLR
jgi:hypothetical protein